MTGGRSRAASTLPSAGAVAAGNDELLRLRKPSPFRSSPLRHGRSGDRKSPGMTIPLPTRPFVFLAFLAADRVCRSILLFQDEPFRVNEKFGRTGPQFG